MRNVEAPVPLEFKLKPNETVTYENGLKFELVPLEEKLEPLTESGIDPVAAHESAHMAAAEAGRQNSTNSASIKPNLQEGYLGVTKLKHLDLVAAVAADAQGHSGTGHDLAIARYFKKDIGALKAAARQRLAKVKHWMLEFGHELTKNKVMNSFDIARAKRRADKRKEQQEYGRKFRLTSRDENGKVKEMIVRTKDNRLNPGEWVTLKPVAATV